MKKKSVVLQGAVVERLPLEQQEPTGPALDGDFQESDLLRNY